VIPASYVSTIRRLLEDRGMIAHTPSGDPS
jgi:hypothetical protein